MNESLESTYKQMINTRVRQYGAMVDDNCKNAVFDAAAMMAGALERRGKLLVFGNGGSSTQSAHFAAELVNRFYFPRPPLTAVALTTDMANITSIANDSDYKFIFSRQMEALAKEGDVALGLTTSGKSPNVLEALKLAKAMKLKTAVLCGRNTGALEPLGIDVVMAVPAEDTPVVQEMHLFILHFLAQVLEEKFFARPKH